MNTEIWLAISRDLFLIDPLFSYIDPLFSYRSLPLRPYKTSYIAITLATRILLLIIAIHTHVVLLLQAAAKVLYCLIKLYFKTQWTIRFITLQLLVALNSANIYGSTKLSSTSICGSNNIDYQWALNEIDVLSHELDNKVLWWLSYLSVTLQLLYN